MEEEKEYEESEYLKAWRALPRSQRDRLTKNQIARMDKPTILADQLFASLDTKPKGLAKLSETKQDAQALIDSKKKVKQKPKQIMMEYKDPVTGEIVRQLVDKVKRPKITALRKAISESRKSLYEERKSLKVKIKMLK